MWFGDPGEVRSSIKHSFDLFEDYLKESRIPLRWCSSQFSLTSGRGQLGYYFIKYTDMVFSVHHNPARLSGSKTFWKG